MTHFLPRLSFLRGTNQPVRDDERPGSVSQGDRGHYVSWVGMPYRAADPCKSWTIEIIECKSWTTPDLQNRKDRHEDQKRQEDAGCRSVRYLGGKSKLRKVINTRLQRMLAEVGPDAEYREAFFGAGGLGLSLLAANPGIKRAWLNDADPAMATLWEVVIHNPTNLHVTVEMTPEAMRLFRRNDYYQDDLELLRSLTGPDDLQRIPAENLAVAKLAVHQMSFSGLGARAGGPRPTGSVVTTSIPSARRFMPAMRSSRPSAFATRPAPAWTLKNFSVRGKHSSISIPRTTPPGQNSTSSTSLLTTMTALLASCGENHGPGYCRMTIIRRSTTSTGAGPGSTKWRLAAQSTDATGSRNCSLRRSLER